MMNSAGRRELVTTTGLSMLLAAAVVLSGAWRSAEAQTSHMTPVINVKDFGAVGDDITDDTAAIQAAVNYAGSASYGTHGGRIFIPEGTYLISGTILFDRKSVIFEGAGWGNATALSYSPGRGTTIRWANGAGSYPMFEVRDSRSVVFRDFKMQGNNNESDRPLAGIRFFNSGSSGHGTNEHLIIENVYIGQYTWTPQGLNQGDVDYGILVDGTNGNNDQMYFNAVSVKSAKQAGIYLANSQSVWSLFMNCSLAYCGTGFYANCDTTLLNCQFNRNDLDLNVGANAATAPWVSIFGYQSEHAKMLVRIGPYAKVFIDGGYSQIGDIDNVDNLIIDGYPSRSGQMLSLRNHSFRQGADPLPKIRLKPDMGQYLTAPNMFVMENCLGLSPSMLDMNLVDAQDRRHIFWRQSDGTFFRQFLSGSNNTVDPTRWEMDTKFILRNAFQHEGSTAGFFGATPVAKPVVTGSWSDGSAGQSLAAALESLGLITDNTTP